MHFMNFIWILYEFYMNFIWILYEFKNEKKKMIKFVNCHFNGKRWCIRSHEMRKSLNLNQKLKKNDYGINGLDEIYWSQVSTTIRIQTIDNLTIVNFISISL